MASPPKIKRLSREDFKEAPPWIDRLLYWLNVLIEYITLAFSNSITFDENIQSEIKTFSVTAGASPSANTAQFMTTLRVVPRGVVLMRAVEAVGNYTPVAVAVYLEWRYEAGSVLITSITGLTSGHTYDLTVLVL